jgi:hypothetical protein
MVAKNDITGYSIKSKVSNKQYRDNWDMIFNNKQKTENKESGRISTVKDGENKRKD